VGQASGDPAALGDQRTLAFIFDGLGRLFQSALAFGPQGITVNTIPPGFIDTPMTQALPEAAKQKLFEAIPLARLGTPQDIEGAYANGRFFVLQARPQVGLDDD